MQPPRAEYYLLASCLPRANPQRVAFFTGFYVASPIPPLAPVITTTLSLIPSINVLLSICYFYALFLFRNTSNQLVNFESKSSRMGDLFKAVITTAAWTSGLRGTKALAST